MDWLTVNTILGTVASICTIGYTAWLLGKRFTSGSKSTPPTQPRPSPQPNPPIPVQKLQTRTRYPIIAVLESASLLYIVILATNGGVVNLMSRTGGIPGWVSVLALTIPVYAAVVLGQIADGVQSSISQRYGTKQAKAMEAYNAARALWLWSGSLAIPASLGFLGVAFEIIGKTVDSISPSVSGSVGLVTLLVLGCVNVLFAVHGLPAVES